MTTRTEAIQAAAAIFVEADLLSLTLPAGEAARRASTPTGPALPDLEARIRIRRLRPAS